MKRVTSRDGTSIAYDRTGGGPALILVTGATGDRSSNVELSEALAPDFTVLNYDRRGRGDSGDTLPFALDREIEDVEALIGVAGGSAHVFGISSGGALVLEAAAAGIGIDRLAVYEVPYDDSADMPARQRAYIDRFDTLLAEGRRGDMAEVFLRQVGMSEEVVAAQRNSPYWPHMERIAHTLAYDAAALGDGRPPVDRLQTIARPTWVGVGGASADFTLAGGGDFFADAARAIADAVPDATLEVLEGQTHQVDPAVLAAALRRFLLD